MKSRNDDREPITADWLDQWADRLEFCWRVPDTDLLIAKSRCPLLTCSWAILREEEDGSETVLDTGQERGYIREALESLGAKADGEELPDFK